MTPEVYREVTQKLMAVALEEGADERRKRGATAALEILQPEGTDPRRRRLEHEVMRCKTLNIDGPDLTEDDIRIVLMRLPFL